MTAQLQSTLNKSTDLRTALVIVDLLGLRLQTVKNFGHHVTTYIADDDFFLEQSTDDDLGRAASLHIPYGDPNNPYDDDNDLIVKFGLGLDFDIVQLGGDLIPVKATPISYTEAVKLCAEGSSFDGVMSIKFNIMELELIVDFLMQWLFPSAKDATNS